MLRILNLKILALLALITGNIIAKIRPIDKDSIKSILVNRTDRLGDAAVSLPFLFELKKRFKVTVLTSRYNDQLLQGIVDTVIYSEGPSSVSEGIIKKPRQAPPECDLYLDLVGISSAWVSLKVKKDKLCRYYAGFNLGPYNRLLDYALPGNPVLFSKRHVLESYRELLKASTGIDLDITDSPDLDKYLIKPPGLDMEPPYILVNIAGALKFRGPSLENYASFINNLRFSGRIIVLDEPGQPNLKRLKTRLEKENLCFLEKDYSLWELAYLAKYSLLYIGSDSGITQLLSGLTNCIVFFASGSSLAWRPYSKNGYTFKTRAGLNIEQTRTSSGHLKKIIYAKKWCSPCFDIGCKETPCIKLLGTVTVRDEINTTLKEISQKR